MGEVSSIADKKEADAAANDSPQARSERVLQVLIEALKVDRCEPGVSVVFPAVLGGHKVPLGALLNLTEFKIEFSINPLP